MPTQLKPGEVEAALIALLKTALADPAVQVTGLSSKDIDKEGSLVLRTVTAAVLVLLEREQLDVARDNTRTTYNASQTYLAICFDQNLRNPGAERADTYELVAAVRDILAGRKLTLADGAKTMPMQLLGTEAYQIDDRGSWYAVRVVVPGMAQFTVKT